MTIPSAKAAIDLLLSDPAKYSTPGALRNLAAQVAIESPGRVTVLYSGLLGKGISSNILIQGMVAQGEDIRVINRTEVAEFLNSDSFKAAVADAFDVKPADIEVRGTPANDFLYEPTKGVWADASARFVAGATGDVRIIAPLAEYNRTLTQVELLKILETPEVTRIYGISKEVFQSIFDRTGSLTEVGKAVSASSYSLIGEMGFHSRVETNADGTAKLNSDGSPKVLIDKIDSTSFLKGLSYEGTHIPPDELNTWAKSALDQSLSSERATILGEGWRNLGLGAKAVALTQGTLKGLGVLGVVVTAYQIKELADQAQAAYEHGDAEGASRIITEGSLQIAGGWAGGIAATQFAAGFFLPLLPTGPTGQVLYLVLVAGSGIGGAFLGEHAVNSLLEAAGGSSESTEPTDDLWKTTTYANGVVVREQTHSPYADNPTAELGDARFGAGWVRFSKQVTIPGENGTTINLWYGKSGVVRWVSDQRGTQIDGSKTVVNADGGTTTTILDASGQMVSSTTVSLHSDGGRTVITSYPDQSLHTVKYGPPSESQRLSLHTGTVREVSDLTLSDDGQRFTVTRDSNGLLLHTSTLTTFEDGSTSETVYYTDGRTLRTNLDENGTVTSRASIQAFEEDGSRLETLRYADGRVVKLSYDGDGRLLSQQEIETGGRTLQAAIGQYGGTLLDSLSLVKAIQSGQPLPVVASGLRLANDLSRLSGAQNLNLSGSAYAASGILSLLSLSNALERGDALGALTAGAQAVTFGARAYANFIGYSGDKALSQAILQKEFGAAGDALGAVSKALPYLSLINSIAQGDMTGAVVAAVDLVLINAGVYAIPYIGWAYAIYAIVRSLFSDEPEIPDPWGNGQYVWNGDGITYQAAGETGGKEAVEHVLNSTLTVLNALIEGQREQSPGSPLGLIPNRLPSVGYDRSGYRTTDIDPLTGAEKHPALRFDTSGRPYNAEPGSPESYQSIVEGMVRSALARGAIAPLWEVQTARKQTDAGDPQAGLSEEERAGRAGQLAAPLTGARQTFRPVALDLDGARRRTRKLGFGGTTSNEGEWLCVA